MTYVCELCFQEIDDVSGANFLRDGDDKYVFCNACVIRVLLAEVKAKEHRIRKRREEMAPFNRPFFDEVDG